MANISKISDSEIATVSKADDVLSANIDKINDVENYVAPSFTDNYALSKSITTGTANAVYFVDTTDAFNFVGDDAWTISIWIKAGWSSSLNTNIHFVVGHKNNTSYQVEDGIKFLYNESNNRIQVRYGNKTTSSNTWYKDGQWLFHANSGAYATGYSAAEFA